MDLYCTLFINCPLSREQLSKIISDFSGGPVLPFFTIENNVFSLSLRKNKEFDPEKQLKKSDDFLYYPYFLEIEPKSQVEEMIYIKEINRLLTFFWSQDWQAVAACGFEELLSDGGGYKRS